nr:AAA family ATPase [Paenibacillus selenitireducens]
MGTKKLTLHLCDGTNHPYIGEKKKMQPTKDKHVVYLLSGPCGVGKSTVSKMLSQELKHAALIVGDNIMHMFEEGYEPPWEKRLSLTWDNITALTRNFISQDIDVIIDYVVEDELEWFCQNLADLTVDIKYVVLRANEDTLIERLNQRGNQELINRSLFLLRQLEGAVHNQPYLLDTTVKEPAAIVKEVLDREPLPLPLL